CLRQLLLHDPVGRVRRDPANERPDNPEEENEEEYRRQTVFEDAGNDFSTLNQLQGAVAVSYVWTYKGHQFNVNLITALFLETNRRGDETFYARFELRIDITRLCFLTGFPEFRYRFRIKKN